MKVLVLGLCIIILSPMVFTQTDLDYTRRTTSATSAGQVITTTSNYFYTGIFNSSGENTVRLPKCCPYGYAVGLGNCSETSIQFQPKFDVHDHNDTAFDDVPINPALITFEPYIYYPCKGKKFPLSPDEHPIILMNGSLLIAGMAEYDGILGQDAFCVDNLDDHTDQTDSTVYAFVCVRELKEGYPQWVFSAYITLITISALLFTSSAVFFYRQDVQSIHKKSFTAYAISMSGTYLIIILMQFISGGCKGFGLLLQFFITLSFAWLAILCFDLAWMIHFYKVKDNLDRFIVYIGASVIYSTVFLIISLTNHFTPDIPSTFFKPQFRKTICSDFEIDQRSALFFAALILTVMIAVVSLGYSLIKMNQNRYKNSTDGVIAWKKVARKFRYMYGRLLISFVTMIIWFLDSFSDRFLDFSGISTIILLVQAFHGFIVVPLFTMKSIRKAIDINKQPRIENLQELIEVSKSFDRI